MPWHPALTSLRDALTRLYPTEGGWRTIVSSAGMDCARVEVFPAMASTWHATLEKALQQDCVDALIAEVLKEYGKNQPFLAAVEGYRAWVAEGRPDVGPPPEPPRATGPAPRALHQLPAPARRFHRARDGAARSCWPPSSRATP